MSEAQIEKDNDSLCEAVEQLDAPAGQACGETASALPEAESESFAALFAAQENAATPSLAPGQRVKVSVVAVTSDTIFVSTGAKVDGIVDVADFDKNCPLPQVGDILDLYVAAITPQEVRMAKTVSGSGGLVALEEAKQASLPVEGKVQAVVKGGFAVEVMKRRAFCPLGQMDVRITDAPEVFVGKTFPFLITRLEKNGRNIVVSRRVLLEREQGESRSAFMATIREGDVVEGVVVRIAPFGAFVELALGVEGLIHLSELSWERIGNAGESVAVGDNIRAKILSISDESPTPRISLSARQVMDNPWQGIGDHFAEGDIISGKVIRNAPFGSFVSVLPGIEGLIHISELSYEKNVRTPDEVVKPGETVTVKVKGIDYDKKRLSLSLKDAGSDPWDSVPELFALDQEVTGTVEKKNVFGIFVTLSPGITGLLPASAISAARAQSRFEKMRPGESIQALVREIDRKGRKITLGLAEAAAAFEKRPGKRPSSSGEEKDWKKHVPQAPAVPFGGTLGMALQAAVLKKK